MSGGWSWGPLLGTFGAGREGEEAGRTGDWAGCSLMYLLLEAVMLHA